MKKMNNCESLVPLKQHGIRTLKFLRISVLLLFVTFSANLASAKAAKSTVSNLNQVQVEQQKRSIKGKVTDESGEAIPGVSVLAKGTTVGTITNIDGEYSLEIPASAKTLVFSFVGMTSKEEQLGTSNEINVSMKSETIGVDEVVVTALGIQREKKTLTYASQQVSGAEMLKARDANFMNALSGKTSGLDIKTSSSGAGGSTKVVLRGNKSLVGLSEPLYVIDGIPMINNKGDQPGSYGGTDSGDGLSSLNSDDIESINVLKGANASILYGSEGANGVVLITTKKGKAGKVDVSVSSSTMLESVSGLPDFQYKYGADGGSDYSWSTKAGNYGSSFIKDFFRTGINTTNSISVSGGNDKTTTYFSYSNVSATGTMPTNRYNKHNFSFNQSTKLFNDKVTISSKVMLSNEESHNRPGAGYYNNPLTGLYLFARERNFDDYKTNYQVFNKDRNLYQMNWYSTEEKQNNPYWELYNDPKLNTSYRAIASLKLAWDISSHMKFEVRGNVDYNNKVNDYRYAAAGNSVSVSPNGSWNYAKYNDRAFYTDGIFTYNNKFGNFSLTALAGASYQHTILNDGMTVSNGTVSLMYPNFYSFSNMPYNVMFNQTIDKRIKEGAFVNAQIGYKDILFLDLSGRNDWASTLALTGNDSYFYPAVGLTAIVSQMVKLPEVVSFAKVRASSSKTANEVPFNKVNPWNSIGGAGTPSGIGGINRNTQVPFTTLKPEEITSNEFGAEMRFFKGRAGFEFTYYSDISKNQFLELTAPSGSGFKTYFVNAGKITNKGFELTVDAEPIRTKTVSWKSSVNLSQNKNKIVELIASNPDYQTGGDDEGFAAITKAGGSFNDVYIYKFARNTAGQIILDGNGVPTKAANQTKVGNVNPDFILGWNNTVTYKNFYVSALVNGKFGGVAFSKTEAFLDSYGVSKRSADARDAGKVAINAIKGTTAVTSIDPVVYYSSIGDRNKIMEPYIFKRTNVRLAQLVIGYNLDVQKLKLPIKDASFSLIGRNLFFFYKDAPYDPENSMSTSNSMQSNEVFSMPATRTFGFNLKFTF
jgi:TonB-linked SusC/RagA family outer membrane protein